MGQDGPDQRRTSAIGLKKNMVSVTKTQNKTLAHFPVGVFLLSLRGLIRGNDECVSEGGNMSLRGNGYLPSQV